MNKLQYLLKFHNKIEHGILINVLDKIEVKIPCINCKRKNRTICFQGIGSKGICYPVKKCEGFNGTLLQLDILQPNYKEISLTTVIEFYFEPFVDTKYSSKCELLSNQFSYLPNWARISFDIKCLQCDEVNNISIQENMRRPLIKRCKNCKNDIYQEKVSPFSYTIHKV